MRMIAGERKGGCQRAPRAPLRQHPIRLLPPRALSAHQGAKRQNEVRRFCRAQPTRLHRPPTVRSAGFRRRRFSSITSFLNGFGPSEHSDISDTSASSSSGFSDSSGHLTPLCEPHNTAAREARSKASCRTQQTAPQPPRLPGALHGPPAPGGRLLTEGVDWTGRQSNGGRWANQKGGEVGQPKH